MTDKEFDNLLAQACHDRCTSLSASPDYTRALNFKAKSRMRFKFPHLAVAAILSGLILGAIIISNSHHPTAVNNFYDEMQQNVESRFDSYKYTADNLRNKIDRDIPIK